MFAADADTRSEPIPSTGPPSRALETIARPGPLRRFIQGEPFGFHFLYPSSWRALAMEDTDETRRRICLFAAGEAAEGQVAVWTLAASGVRGPEGLRRAFLRSLSREQPAPSRSPLSPIPTPAAGRLGAAWAATTDQIVGSRQLAVRTRIGRGPQGWLLVAGVEPPREARADGPTPVERAGAVIWSSFRKA